MEDSWQIREESIGAQPLGCGRLGSCQVKNVEHYAPKKPPQTASSNN